MSREALLRFFTDPDMRPTLLAEAEGRQREAQDRRSAREAVVKQALDSRRGRWRFRPLARLANAPFTDELTGLEASTGYLVRDSATGEQMRVASTTVTIMRRRRQMAWFDHERLPKPATLAGPDGAECDAASSGEGGLSGSRHASASIADILDDLFGEV